MKDYLYKVDEKNNLIKNFKRSFDRVGRSKMVGFKLLEDDKVFSIDYKKEDKIKEIPELTKIINELKERSEYDSTCHIRLNSNNEKLCRNLYNNGI